MNTEDERRTLPAMTVARQQVLIGIVVVVVLLFTFSLSDSTVYIRSGRLVFLLFLFSFLLLSCFALLCSLFFFFENIAADISSFLAGRNLHRRSPRFTSWSPIGRPSTSSPVRRLSSPINTFCSSRFLISACLTLSLSLLGGLDHAPTIYGARLLRSFFTPSIPLSLNPTRTSLI